MKRIDIGRGRSRAVLLGGAALLAFPAAPAYAQSGTPLGSPGPAAPVGSAGEAGAQAPITGAAPAAAEDTGQLADIVVTAQRREERLQNVPIAITAVTGEALKSSGVSSSMDLSQVVPGLNMTRAVGISQLPFIRGVGTTQQGVGVETPVATYVDGVYIYSQAGAALNLSDIEQIAVLKGPQGTLFGRNATGGVIQYTTRQPSFTTKVQGEVSYGNLQQYGANLYATTGLTRTIAVSVAASYSGQDRGFGINLANGAQLYTHHNYQSRGKLLWEPASGTTITLSGDYSHYDGAQPVNRIAGDRTIQGTAQPGTAFDTNLNYMPYSQTRGGGGSLTIKQDLGGPQLVSITAYRIIHSDNGFDADGTPLAVQQNQFHGFDHNWSQEVQLVSQAGGRFTWVLGVFALGERNGSTADSCGLFSPVAPSCTNRWTQGYAGLQTIAGFAQGTFKLTDTTNLTGGIRYSHDKRYAVSYAYAGGTDQAPAGALTLLAAPADITFSNPSYRVAIDHRFSPELLAYASFNHGFRSGQYGNLGTVTPPVPSTPVALETIDAFETGFKADLLDNHLRLNVSEYYYRDHNHVSVQIVNGNVLSLQAPLATFYGMDADMTWRVTNQFSLTLGLALEHSNYDNFGTAACAGNPAAGVFLSNCGTTYTRRATVLAPRTNYVIALGNDTGHQVESTPPFTLSAAPSYVLPTSAGEIRTTVTFYRNGGWFASPSNYARQQAYNTLAAEIVFTPSFTRNLAVRLFGTNLTDTSYAEQYSESDAGPNYQVARGRSYGVALQFRY